MTVVAAMLLDAYRELNSKKLFWITLVLSGMVVICYGSIGFDEDGMSILYGLKHVDSEFIKQGSPWARAMYMGIFSDFVVTIWLSWIAIILALISTTTIFPDFVASGTIDLVLAKPITRIKLFVIKYLTSLLFVVLQVGLFCVGVFACVGLRLGEWNWMIFAAVPIVTVFYSYLYSANVLTGILTRSAITALLLTMLFWFGLWSIQSSEVLLNQFRFMSQIQAERAQEIVDRVEASLATADDAENGVSDRQRLRWERELDGAQEDHEQAQELEQTLTTWHRRVRVGVIILPKTQHTVGLLSRWLKDPQGFSIIAMMRGDMTGMMPGSNANRPTGVDAETSRRMEAYYDDTSPWFIITSSLGFELLVLGVACWMFVRRDY
ncbi:MAG: ABC transporter permease [Planctomycetota bacterium]|nr:ABC transporter permease [Planctomycetota bacterium]